MYIKIIFFIASLITQACTGFYVLRIGSSKLLNDVSLTEKSTTPNFPFIENQDVWMVNHQKNVEGISEEIIYQGADNIRDQITEYANEIRALAVQNPKRLQESFSKLSQRASDLQHQGQDALADEIRNFIKSVRDEQCEAYLFNALDQNLRIYQQAIAEIWELLQNN